MLFYEFRHFEKICSFIPGYRGVQNRRVRGGRNENGTFPAFRRNQKRGNFSRSAFYFFLKKESWAAFILDLTVNEPVTLLF